MSQEDVKGRFTELAELPDDEIDLAEAALLIAATQYPDLDMERERGSLDTMSSVLWRRFGGEDDALSQVNALSEYLFDELGFHGNQEDYYDPRNSFLNEVLTRRTGIPITLSLVYVEIGKRLGIPLVGVGMPGHFMVRHRDVRDLFVDAFYGGILLSENECVERLKQVTGVEVPWDPQYLNPVSNREFVGRMLRNLKNIYLQQQDFLRALTMTDLLVTMQPYALNDLRDRGLVHYRLGNYPEAQADLKEYMAAIPLNPDSQAIEELMQHIEEILEG